jgi:hypothetical protein
VYSLPLSSDRSTMRTDFPFGVADSTVKVYPAVYTKTSPGLTSEARLADT